MSSIPEIIERKVETNSKKRKRGEANLDDDWLKESDVENDMQI
jgi:hypothetical protein